MRIALATKGLWPATVGGIERHSHFLASHLVDQGCEVTVLTPEAEPEDLEETPYRTQWLATPDLPSYWLETHRQAQLFTEALNQGTYDVVYGQDMTCAHFVKQRSRPPLIWNPHGLELFHTTTRYLQLRALPYRQRHLRLARGAERSVSLGGKLDEIFLAGLGVPPERLAVIPNGIDPDYVAQQLPEGTQRERTELLWVGRIHSNKGVDLLIDAFNDLAGEDVGLTLVGGGPEAEEMQARNKNPRVRFAGRVSDEELFRLLASSGGMVFSSRFEGMPTVILEAMMAWLPVVATDIGAVATMVREDETGILVSPGSADSLRDGIRTLLEWDDAKREEVCTAARNNVLNQFSWRQVAAKTLEVCQDLAGDA